MNKLNLPPFYIGQKVVCVKPSEKHGLFKDKIYTITDVKRCICGCTQVSWGVKTTETGLNCASCDKDLTIGSIPEYYALASRFCPAEEKPLPLLTFEQIKKEEKEEILILN